MTADLPSLISRLEAASENDVALFMDVYDAVTPSPTDDGTRTIYLSGGLRFLACLRCDAFLDAITALIERALPGWGWSVGEPLGKIGYWANVWREGFSISNDGQVWRAEGDRPGLHPDKSTGAGEFGHQKRYAPTPALALCLALVRAKAAQEKQEPQS